MTDKLREEDLFALYSETKAQGEVAAQAIAALGTLVGELRTAIPAALRQEAAAQLAPAVALAHEQLSRSVAQHQTSLEHTANQVLRAAAAMKQSSARTRFYAWAALFLLCVVAGIGAGAGAFYYLSGATAAAPAIAKPPAKGDGMLKKGRPGPGAAVAGDGRGA